MCGEESFGTGSNHVREKDGLWAILCWMQILAHKNNHLLSSPSSNLISIQDIMEEHWRRLEFFIFIFHFVSSRFGRNYCQRMDFENVDSDQANLVMEHLENGVEEGSFVGFEVVVEGETLVLSTCSNFSYQDPLTKSTTSNQGIILKFSDNHSRIVFRKSGTSGSGATIRIYCER